MSFRNEEKMQENHKVSHQNAKMLLHHRDVIILFEELIHGPWGREIWRPVMDVSEQDDLFIIKADLPGISVDDLKVSASENKILIEGIRLWEERGENTQTYICERPKGKFVREIEFIEPISPTHIQTQYENGVLTIIVKKVISD